MTPRGLFAALLLAANLSLASCAPDASEPSQRASDRPANPTPLVADVDAEDRVAFGCALQRGIADADGITRHYGGFASRELFRAALQADLQFVVAARLWQANDEVLEQDSGAARANLLGICSEAGFTRQAGLPELRAYMCRVNAELGQVRPTLGSYGPADTRRRPGDPRRSDASFVGFAQFLLSLKVDKRWIGAESAAVALDDGNDGQYRAALRELADLCARR